MNLLRLIILGVLIWLAAGFIKRLLNPPQQPRTAKRPSARPIGTMVRCDHCGLHLPKEEAIYVDGHYYCSQAHLEAARSRHTPD